jgi:predicted transcriptional regulator
MMARKKTKLEKPLTEVELQLMNVIWDLQDCTVKDVQKALPPDRDLAYTSVATVMKILEQKGALVSTKSDKAHTYKPLVSRSDYEKASLDYLATNVFKGNPTSMVMRLLNDSKLSSDELEIIKKVLEERQGH